MAAPRLAPLRFDDLAQRLVRDLSQLIHSGRVTERRLAMMVDLSQPHLHNVVNGVRTMTPRVADQIMNHLDWSLLDLLESAEAQALLSRRQASLAHGCEIPLARKAVGFGFSLPGEEFAEITVPNSWLARAEKPVAVSAGDDPEMTGTFLGSDVLFLDCGESARMSIREDGLYVVCWQGSSVARWLRFSPRGLYLVASCHWGEPCRWPLVLVPDGKQLDVVEARIIALAQPPDGTFRPPVPRSVSS